MRWVEVVAVAALVAGLTAGCGEDDEPGSDEEARWSVPREGFCDEVAVEAGLDSEVDEMLSDISEQTMVTCVLLTETSRVDLIVQVGENAGDQYQLTLGELRDGFTGFRRPEVSEPDGWWSEGTRFEAVEIESVRLTDLLLDDTLVVRLQLVETPASGSLAERQAGARDTADALNDAVAAVLEKS